MFYFDADTSGFIHSSHGTQHQHEAGGGDATTDLEKLGVAQMPISCAASVQAPFERGSALVHSF
jgi:hypothetical protein